MSRIVGIDLGTTNSLVAYVDGAGVPRVIPDAEGRRLLASIVAYTPNGVVVGEAARRQLARNPARTVYSVKRFMGRGWDDVREEARHVPFTIVPNAEVVRIRAGDREVTPPEVSAQVLRALKLQAEAHLAESIERAVITVPAYFNDAQRQATKDAGRIAGLEVLRIVNEPTAASLAYGLQKLAQGVIAVYDLGGGTFDISILRVKDGVFEVLATNGNTYLGGDDFDRAMVQWLLGDIRATHGVDLSTDPEALQELRLGAEAAKCRLSSEDRTALTIPFEGFTYRRDMTRAELERLIAPLVDATLGPCRMALEDAGLAAGEIDEIVLVGGSTRVPLVRRRVQELFGKTPHSQLNPDEVVALGAAVQAGVLAGEVRDIVLLDVTPLSLGLETLGGVMTKLIPRNTTLPTSKSEVFSTAADGQTSVEINVLQGEREFVRDNTSLGTFRLDGIPPAPRGVPQVEVKFDIDATGILSVTATDKGTGKAQDIKITGASTLSSDDVDRMVADAEKFADEDKTKREAVDVRNSADSMIYQAEKQVKEFGDKVPAELKAKVEAASATLKDAVAKEDVPAMKAGMEALQAEVMAIGQAVYSAGAGADGAAGAAPGADGAAPPPPGGADDTVIDADFTDSK